MKDSLEQRTRKAEEEGIFKIPEAALFLKEKGCPYTDSQLRIWCKKNLVPHLQPTPGSHILLKRETLDSILEGELPKSQAA